MKIEEQLDAETENLKEGLTWWQKNVKRIITSGQVSLNAFFLLRPLSELGRNGFLKFLFLEPEPVF